MSLSRLCRECGVRSTIADLVQRCPDCGAAYGPLVLGLDVDPAEVARGIRATRADIDADYRRKLAEGRREDIRREVYGIEDDA